MIKKDFFLKKIVDLQKNSNWREINNLCLSLPSVDNKSIAYVWCQSLIKLGKFIKAEDVLNHECLAEEKNTAQYLKLRHDLFFSRKNFPMAITIARDLIEMQPTDLDPKIRLARSLLANDLVQEAEKVGKEIQKKFPPSQVVDDLLKSIEARKFDNEIKLKRLSDISTKFNVLDIYDLPTPKTTGCSVVVPCYNVEAFIEATLESIINCAHDDLEILLVEDCSTDETPKILKNYQAAYPRLVKIIHHKKNSGLAAARNSGLMAANMPYVTFIDSDDLMVKGGITRRVRCLRNARATDILAIGSYGASATIAEDALVPPSSKSVDGMKIVDYLSSSGLCPFNANQPLFITEFLRRSGGFPESARTAEDWPYWLRLLRMGGKIYPTHTLDVTYRMRRGSMVRATAAKHMDNSFEIIKSINKKNNLLFSKPYHEYEDQKKFIERFFNFWGMRIAASLEKNKNHELLASELSVNFIEDLDRYLPDFSLMSPGVKFIKSRIKQGVCRFYCVTTFEEIDEHRQIDDIIRGFAVGAASHAANNFSRNQKNLYKKLNNNIDVVFLPHKKYHAHSAALIGEELIKLGLTYKIVDFSAQYGEEGVADYLATSDVPSVTFNELALSLDSVSLAVVFNDWDPVARFILDFFKSQGARSLGIVEGVNDYLSVDTGVWRPAYRYVDSLLVPGTFHAKYFSDHEDLHVAGVQRLDPMLSNSNNLTPTSERKIDCVINCNFTYGVLTEHRIFFLKKICDVLLEIGITPVISRHPQDVGDIGELQKYVTTRSMYDLLNDCKIFITRFSGAVYEALLSGSHVVYFNPGIEKWDMFFDPMGAYSYIDKAKDLKNEILKLLDKDYHLSCSSELLSKHCNIDFNSVAASSKQSALCIEKILSRPAVNVFNQSIANIKKGVFFEKASKLNLLVKSEDYDAAFKLIEEIRKEFTQLSDVKKAILESVEKRLSYATYASNRAYLIKEIEGLRCENLFLIFSCEKYKERLKLLRSFYNERLKKSDAFIFVIGGSKETYLKDDILYLACGDTYEKLPEKVFYAFKYASDHLKFKRIVKIDDDIFVNFKNFYKVISDRFYYDYYGRKNPPKFGHPLNRKWHFGKVTEGHKYEKSEFPLIEPAQWCSGGCYVISHRSAAKIAHFQDMEFVSNHVFEDYMIYDILSNFEIYPFFHEDSFKNELRWMDATLDSVLNKKLDATLDEFSISSVVTIHCGPTNKYSVSNEDLVRIFSLLGECDHPI